jgi:probable F420-dependent oxidoreductase
LLTFGFGLFPFSRFADADDLAQTVVVGERLGFAVVGIPEHLLLPTWPTAPEHTKVWHDQLTLAAYLAGCTSRIEFLTSILVVPYHPPVQLAKALVTLDLMSRGRIRLGVGAGWMRAEFRRLGIPYEERGAITDEYLRAMRELWTAERPSFTGRYVSIDDVSFLPRPTRPTGVPIVVGGSGPRPLRRLAELGDGWVPLSGGPREIEAGLEALAPLLAERGRTGDSIWVAASLRVDPDPEIQQMVVHAEADGGAGGGAAAGGGGGHSLTAEECVDRLEELQAAGADHVGIVFGWRNGAELRERLAWFAESVMPRFEGTGRNPARAAESGRR